MCIRTLHQHPSLFENKVRWFPCKHFIHSKLLAIVGTRITALHCFNAFSISTFTNKSSVYVAHHTHTLKTTHIRKKETNVVSPNRTIIWAKTDLSNIQIQTHMPAQTHTSTCSHCPHTHTLVHTHNIHHNNKKHPTEHWLVKIRLHSNW